MNTFISFYGFQTHYEALTDNERYYLGRMLYPHITSSQRAEALVECDGFEKHAKELFEKNAITLLYFESVAFYVADIYSVEYDHYIDYLNRMDFEKP